MISASQTQASATATDLLSASSLLGSVLSDTAQASSSPSQPFDAVIAIGTLIKGSTMHFEYICEAVSQGLMRVQLDTGVPVIFGVLTVLEDIQALERAGIAPGENKGHNHGEDWGSAAVEMGSHCRRWTAGKFS
jgi:6,7-dimethyl-8-ribityllumazine synthase